jgi:hypothetical protein
MPSQEYIDYLRSDTWQRLRSERLKIDGYKCQRCGRPFDLQVHHLYYPLELGTEDPYRDLITLCDMCHETVEQQKTDYKTNLRHKQEVQKTDWRMRRERELNLINHVIKHLAENDLSNVGTGTRDYCRIDIIIEDFGPIFEDEDLQIGYISRVQCYFRNRRYEIILDKLEQGWTPWQIRSVTKFSSAMINKVAKNPEGAKQLLAKEKEDND